ncbi:MAG: hypothetical protein Q9219_000668 [cf. Caloplaca sp. 3 TL-2023]
MSRFNSLRRQAVLPSPAPSDEQCTGSCQPVESEINGQIVNNQAAGESARGQSSDWRSKDKEIEEWNNSLQNSVSAVASPGSSAPLAPDSHAQVGIANLTAAASNPTYGSLPKKRKRSAPGPITISMKGINSSAPPAFTQIASPLTPSDSHHKPSDAFMQSMTRAVMARQQAVAQEDRTGKNTELSRLSLLQTACVQNDHFYLLLHQIYCLHPARLNSPDRLSSAGLYREHLKGLEMLGLVLRPNPQAMIDGAIEWFAAFPFPFEKLLCDFEIYREALDNIKSCLAKFAQIWPSFRDLCLKRRCPPFSDELGSFLGVESPVLQTYIFRSIHRYLWNDAVHDSCHNEGEKLFHENRHLLRQRSMPVSEEESRRDTQDLIIKYNSFQTTHMAHIRQSRGNISNNQISASLTQTPVFSSSDDSQRRSPWSQSSGQINRNTNPVSSYLNTQLAQPVVSTTANSGSPVVSSLMLSLGQNSPSVQQNPSSAFPASNNATSLSPALQNLQVRGQANGGSPLMSSPISFQRGPFTWGQRPSNNSRFPRALSLDQSRAAHPMQLQRSPTYPQAINPAAVLHVEQSTPSNRSSVQQAYGTNTRPWAMYQQPLLSPSGESLSATIQLNPMNTALHQHHLRSPILTAVDGSGLGKKGTKSFQYIKKVSLLNGRLRIGSRQHLEWSFDFNNVILGSLPGPIEEQNGSLPQRTVRADSAFCRIRCIDASKFQDVIRESDWVVARQVWPSNITILLNGKPVEVRKKLHYGKDLPVDITTLVQKGTNTLSASIIRAQSRNETEYAFGLESIRFLTMEAAKALTRPLPYDETRQRILHRFQTSDPDIEVMNASISLSLTDPYTFRIWDVPTRSELCLHDECFDLDTFFQTRSSKRPGQPSDPDQFQCPICGADARPQRLVRDEFFSTLRDMLGKQDRLDAKAIIMQQNGSWHIKEEEKPDENGAGSGMLPGVRKGGETTIEDQGSNRWREVETIEIDDD